MSASEPPSPSSNGFDEWQSIDERNGSDKSSNSGSQNSSSWYLVQVSFILLARVVFCIFDVLITNIRNIITLNTAL